MKPRRAIFCKGCLQQLHLPIPIHGPLSIPLRIVGLRRSRMNPNMCNLCETMFKHIKKSSQVRVPLTILFADVRGYTTMSELADSPEIIRLLSDFYERSGEAVWERDGIVNKLIGDALLGASPARTLCLALLDWERREPGVHRCRCRHPHRDRCNR